MGSAGQKAKFLQLEPTSSSSVPTNCLFLDSNNANALTYKNNAGSSVPVSSSSSDSLLIKRMQASQPIPPKVPFSKLSDGTIIKADSDAVNARKYLGVTLEEALNSGDWINVLLVGPNMVGAVSGLGFAPGDEVYLSQNGGYTNDYGSFTDSDDDIIRIGYADCSTDTASGVADDLVMFSEIVFRI